MAYIREVLVETPLVNMAKNAGGMAYKFVSPGRRAVPDRILCFPGGVICFVECKAPGEKATPAQLREHVRLRRLGFRVEVIDHKDKARALIRELTPYEI